ncbi:MAG: hypothetical protein ACHQF2_00545 [Flavobacteriales bacterium]
MKRGVELAAACAVAMMGFSMISSERKMTTSLLEDALTQQKIELACTGLGGHSGKSVELTIKNNSGAPLQLRVPQGTLFEASNSSEQNLVVPETELISLAKGEKKKYKVSGFCTELHDMSPDKGSGFSLSRTNDSVLVKLVNYITRHPGLPTGAIQEAIWCVTNGSNVSNICNETPAKVKELREFVCSLTAKKDVWYDTPRERIVTPERLISNVPTIVTGMLEFEATEIMKVKSEIRDSLGKVITANPETMTFPKGKFHFDFKVTVKGWEKGKYTVIYYTETKTLIKQEFEI